jgi:hypothetical protein
MVSASIWLEMGLCNKLCGLARSGILRVRNLSFSTELLR